MKRCPECRRDYYDDSLLYCLDDGSALLDGPASADEPATAIFNEPPGALGTEFGQSSREAAAAAEDAGPSESGTRPQISTLADHGSHSRKRNFLRSRSTFIVAFCFVAALLGLGGYLAYRRYRPGAEIRSIAVLPFDNGTQDQRVDYLADGITESLINSLSRLPDVKVTARNSVFSYKDKHPDLSAVADQLGVRAIMTGRVLTQGDNLDIRVEVTDAKNNVQLWGDHYTRKATDIFSIEDDIARQVTDALRLRLSSTAIEQVQKQYTDNAEAYKLYLQGRYYLTQVGAEGGLIKAASYFDQAIALDPNYALAYAARGDVMFNMGDMNMSMSEAHTRSKADITTALSLDPTLVEARTSLANIQFQFDRDFAGAEANFRQVIASSPNFAEGHHSYGWFLSLMGRQTEARSEMALAERLDPVNPPIVVDVNLPYYFDRQYDESLVISRRALELFPNHFLPHLALGSVLTQKGDFAAAIAELEKARAIESDPLVDGSLGYTFAKAGRRDDALKILAELKDRSKTRYIPPYWIAVIYSGLGQNDDAFEWLQKSFDEREWWLIWLKVDPRLDGLRSDPRYADIVKCVGLTQN